MTEVEKLDLAARAEAVETMFARVTIIFTLLSAFFVFLSVISTASLIETVAVRALTLYTIFTTFLLWRRSRYAVAAVSIMLVLIVVGTWLPFSQRDFEGNLGSADRAMVTVILVLFGSGWLNNAIPFAVAQSRNFQAERSQIQEWIDSIKSGNGTGQLIEFSSKSLTSGHWTYRLLSAGNYWVLAKFKPGPGGRLSGCRVLERGRLRLAENPIGELIIVAAGRLIPNVDISPEMRGILTSFVRTARD